MKQIVKCLFLLLLNYQLQAQAVTIKGQVTTGDGEVLPFANIYINNTSIGASTDVEGNYEFAVELEGFHKFICSYVGFSTSIVEKQLTGKDQVINFRLSELTGALDQVVVKTKKAKDWERNLKKFERNFYGSKEVSRRCEIINPYVLDFDIVDRSIFRAKAIEPVVIENRYLGYEVTMKMESYWAILNTERQAYSGFLFFKELDPQSSQEEEVWIENRKETYLGSVNHFLRSLAVDSLEQNGFHVYVENKKFDELTLVNMGKLKELNYDLAVSRLGDYLSIQFDGFLRVEYDGRREPVFFGDETRQINETSWIELRNKKALFSKDGYFINPLEATLHGAYSLSGIGSILPIDFTPFKEKSKTLNVSDDSTFFENIKIYDSLYTSETVEIEIDSSAQFVPGMQIAFKAKVRNNKGNQELSQVLYLELIGPDCNHLLYRKIQIKDGHGSGAFYLPSTLYSGNYLLMAYTSWMKNFSQDLFYKKVIELGQKKKYEATSIQFYPEYGALFEGKEDVLMIRTRNSHGLPSSGNVTIFNDENNIVAKLKTDSMGVEKIEFSPKVNTKYYAQLNNSVFKWELPSVKEKEFVFSIVNEDNLTSVKVENKLKEDRTVYVVSQNSDVLRFFKRVLIKSGNNVSIEIENQKLGRGIVQISVLDDSFAVLANKSLLIDTEKNRLELLDQSDWWASHLRQNLNDLTPYSWMEISRSKEVLNKFIMSHTWRQFDYEDIYNAEFRELEFVKEKGLVISGKVDVKSRNYPIELDVLVKSESPQVFTTQIHEDGLFRFNDVHYTDTTDLIFNLENRLDTEYEVTFDTVSFVSYPPDYLFCLQQQNAVMSQDEPSEVSDDVTVLEEVEISTSRNLVEDDPIETVAIGKRSFSFSNSVMKGNMVSRGGVLRYLESRISGSRVLYDRINGNVRGILLATHTSYDISDVALLFHNDLEVTSEVLDAINPNLIERIDVLTGVEAASYGFRGSKGVILVYSLDYLESYNKSVKSVLLKSGYDVE